MAAILLTICLGSAAAAIPFDTCGVLWDTTGCLFLRSLDGGTYYLLSEYGVFQAGDTVRAVGVRENYFDTVCNIAAYYVLNEVIEPCWDSLPYPPVEYHGVLIPRAGCIAFVATEQLGLFFELDDYGIFGPGDSVIVSGYLNPDCDAVCDSMDACILNNIIMADTGDTPGYPYASAGILVNADNCMLFAPQGDSMNFLIWLENYADFVAGDTVAVSGYLEVGCQTICTAARACLNANTIDTVVVMPELIPGNLIVRLSRNFTYNDVLGGYDLVPVDSIPEDQIYLVSLQGEAGLDSMMNVILGDTAVLFAEPNFSIRLPENLQVSMSFPDEYAPDYNFDERSPAAFFFQTARSTLQVDSALQLSAGNNVVVAVIDNGVDSYHPFLSGTFYSLGYDFFNNDSDPSPDSGLGQGHGTFVAGLIRLFAPSCRIMPLKALDGNGVGNTFAIAKAINYAVDSGAQIINMSFGFYQDSYVLAAACERAISAGLILVAACGNDSTFLPMFPASYPGVIAVGAVDTADYRADFSNFGGSLDICAPGVNLYSSLFGQYDWGRWSGTSFAAPLVSAICALVLGCGADFNSYEMELHMRFTAERELPAGTIVPPDLYYGFGRVDAAAAVWSLPSAPPVNGCGDANNDGTLDVTDVVVIINYVFHGGGLGVADLSLVDVNNDDSIDVSDAIFLINFLFIDFSPAPNCGD